MRIFLGLFCLMISFSVQSSGQTIITNKRSVTASEFRVDYSEFYDILHKKSRLEIYYQIYNSDLLFIRDGDKFGAKYSLSVSIHDKNNIPIISETRDKEIIVDQYSRTMSRADFRTGQLDFYLSPGKYKVECFLLDNNSKKSVKKTFNVTAHKFDRRKPQVSGIEFVFAVDSVIYDSAFIKSGMTIIPNVGRVYGEDTASVFGYYFEIYKGKSKAEKVLIETRLLDRKLKTMHFDSVTVAFDGPIIAQLRQIALRKFKGGEYTLEIILKGYRGRSVDNSKKTFNIYWSPEAMVLNDYKTAVRQLKYIAVPSEMKEIEKISSSEERLKAWEKFWDSRDPTPGTIENEARLSYYYRIEQANRRFSVMRRDGWQTDRGMILIMYGEPDQIEDYPFEPNNRAYQIWSYYHVDSKPREFLFIDEWNNNDFILQYPYDGVRY
ncbi:MAG TPA: GWxTD domain-containing protein [candidate division Zixibacteria bacterium]|nr:GWxTD domain-containing protein [candidate division Zixibacteria bacterium]